MPHFSPVELLIVFMIVLVLFGGGRVARLGGELGTAIREFRKGLEGNEKPAEKKNAEEPSEPTTESN